MEIFTPAFWGSLFSIVFIDLVLAGDNAIVIGMAARNLPENQRGKAIFWGTAGAICLRLITTVIVIWLLQIPALMLTGGLALIWIGYNLLTSKKERHISAPSRLGQAIRTIIIADGAMGIDNVMGVAGVAHGNFALVFIGVLITIPIIIWGSTAFIALVEKYPAVIYAGGAILAWTAGGMITGDPLLKNYFSAIAYSPLLLKLLITIGILWSAHIKNRQNEAY